MGIKTRLSATRVVVPVVFVVLALLAGSGFAVAQRAVRDDERRLLHERAGEAAAVLASSASNITASLRLLGDVYAADPQAQEEFADGANPLLSGGLISIGVAEVTDDGVIVRVGTGTGPVRDDRLDGARADLYKRAASTASQISSRIDLALGARTVLAFAAGRTDGLVVFADLAVAPNVALPSSPQSPFGELAGALYRTPTADPAGLLLTTSTHLPLTGTVDERTITVGSEQWLLVTVANRPIAGAQSRALPWIILIGGLVVAAMAAAAIGIATRRRQYALSLVEERTADLHRAMIDLESARAAADDANRAKSQFLSRMSHELRTPLNAVLGFAQLLQLAELDRAERDSVGHIIKGGNHLLTLINEVLDISRIESGDITMSPESVLASEVVEETINLLQPLAAERSIHLSASPDAMCVQYVFADRQRLKQILLNLLSNAIKYNRVGGSVSLTCEHPSPTRLRVKVTDTGPGIARENLNLVFVPFERLGADRTDVEGSGIGLALSRRLAEAMSGEIGVESELGTGSTFWIELPLVEGAVDRFERLDEHQHLPETPVVPAALVRNVLYIEDNLANLTLVERIVAHRPDLRIIPAMQGRLGLDLARQQRPAVILLDLHLPDTNGELVLQQLRDDPVTRTIPVIIISADATTSQVQRLQTAGASAYITKPINVRELLQLLDEHLPADTLVHADEK